MLLNSQFTQWWELDVVLGKHSAREALLQCASMFVWMSAEVGRKVSGHVLEVRSNSVCQIHVERSFLTFLAPNFNVFNSHFN